MKRNPLPTRLAVSMIMRLFTIALIAHAAACDDDFLFPLCGEGTPSKCMQPPPDMPVDMTADIAPPPPVSDFRKFIYRTQVPLRKVGTDDKQFIGFEGPNPHFLVSGQKKRIQSFIIDLKTSDSPTPNEWGFEIYNDVNNMTFDKDRFLKTGGLHLFFRPNHSVTCLNQACRDRISSDLNMLSPALNFRPFIHPSDGSLVVYSPGNNKIYARFNEQAKLHLSNISFIPRSVCIGNIDAIDQNNKTSELIINNENGGISHTIHQGSNPVDQNDANFAGALSSAISAQSAGGYAIIQAAFVHNINNDRYPDYVFSKNNTIYVVSYKGREWLDKGKSFEIWPPQGLIVDTQENVIAIFLINIDNDEFPDLVIETNKSVRFYHNVAEN